jgi:hypothetical protein
MPPPKVLDSGVAGITEKAQELDVIVVEKVTLFVPPASEMVNRVLLDIGNNNPTFITAFPVDVVSLA